VVATSSYPIYPIGVYDSMEQYATGSIFSLNSGSAMYTASWTGNGLLAVYTNSFAADDFENYITGSASTFSSGGYYWYTSGSTAAYLYSSVDDNMEQYLTGSITTFDSGSSYSASWFSGTIIT
jgi:hypothetical protein